MQTAALSAWQQVQQLQVQHNADADRLAEQQKFLGVSPAAHASGARLGAALRYSLHMRVTQRNYTIHLTCVAQGAMRPWKSPLYCTPLDI